VNSPPVLIEGLRKAYGDAVAVDGLDLTVGAAEVFGLLGRNGAGKTTTIETMVGLLRPDAGRIRVLGLDPQRDSLRLKQRIGVQLQEAVFHPSMRLGEALDFLGGFYLRRAATSHLLDRVGLAPEARSMFGRLSGGQRRRFLLAVALLGEPELLVLDEPTAGLDAHARADLWATVRDVRAEGRTVLLATHHLEEAEALCDRVAIIHHGRVLALGTPAEVAALGPPSLESAFLALTAEDSTRRRASHAGDTR
jgi:ABC-2 type transport system ATP-binding protein